MTPGIEARPIIGGRFGAWRRLHDQRGRGRPDHEGAATLSMEAATIAVDSASRRSVDRQIFVAPAGASPPSRPRTRPPDFSLLSLARPPMFRRYASGRCPNISHLST